MRFVKFGLLAAALLGALWVGFVVRESPVIQAFLLGGGYVGVFFFSIVNGFNVFVPIVTASFVPALVGAGLNVSIVVALIALGTTIADCATFFLARAGRVHLSASENKLMKFLFAAEERRHWLPLLILALWATIVPIPSEVILIPLGLLGFPSRHVVPILFIGNLLFSGLIAFGALGILAVAA